MVKLVEVTELPEELRGRPSTVSTPILTEFVESAMKMAKLELEPGTNINGLAVTLRTYIRNKGLPIKVMMKGTDLYLMRTDLQ